MEELKVVYIPYFNKGWHILKIDTTKARFLKSNNYNDSIIYYGTIYNGSNLFLTEEGAQAYIYKDYKNAHKSQVKSGVFKWENTK